MFLQYYLKYSSVQFYGYASISALSIDRTTIRKLNQKTDNLFSFRTYILKTYLPPRPNNCYEEKQMKKR